MTPSTLPQKVRPKTGKGKCGPMRVTHTGLYPEGQTAAVMRQVISWEVQHSTINRTEDTRKYQQASHVGSIFHLRNSFIYEHMFTHLHIPNATLSLFLTMGHNPNAWKVIIIKDMFLTRADHPPVFLNLTITCALISLIFKRWWSLTMNYPGKGLLLLKVCLTTGLLWPCTRC